MADLSSLPRQNSELVKDGNTTPTWYNFFRRLVDRVSNLENAPPPIVNNGGSGSSNIERVIVDSTTTRLLSSDDSNCLIEFTNAGAITVTVPSNTLLDFCNVYLTQGGTGQITVVAGSGVVIDYTDTLKSRTQESTIGIKQIQANKFEMFGDVEPVALAKSALIRAANSSGVPAWVAPTADSQKLKQVSGALAWATDTASEIVNVPAGNIAATNVQAALAELDAEKAPLVHTHVLTNVTDVTMTVANLNSLDDGVNTALHFHDSDRARANHTGTQLAATVSDFNSASRAQTEAELIAGANITITPASSGATRTLTIAASGGGGVSDGDKGDITVTASGATWTVDNDVVTFAKMQNIATARLLGRATSASGDVEEITLGTNLSFAGTTLNATGGGGSVANGTATIDFGAFPGLNEITGTVTGQALITATSRVTAVLFPAVSSNHTLEDHLFASNIINITAGNLVAGTGFTIYARSMDKLQGVYNINWTWV